MPSSYSTNLKIELQATGENSGTWGTITNTNLGTALEQAVVGYGNPSYPSDANLTLTYTDTNAAQAARALVLNVTSAVSLSATRELVVPTIQKQYIVQNNTSGSQSITVKTSAGTGITVPNGRKAHLYVNGTDVIFMDDYVDINGGTIDGTTIGANSAAAGNFTTVDTTNIEVTNLKAKDGTTAGSIADATGVVTLGSSVLTTTDINGGTIDGTTIGGSSAAAGTFTTLTTSSTVTLNGGTANGVLYLNGSKVATSGSALTFDGSNALGFGTGGTGSTAAVLTLKGSSATNYGAAITGTRNGSGSWFIGDSGTALGGGATGFIYYNYTSGDPWIWYDGGASTERMRLTSTGLGIGTASPAYKLHIVGGAAIANRTTSDTPGNVSLGVLSTSSVAQFGWRTDSSNNLNFDIYNGASWSAALTTSLAGNLGLGVTPSASSVKTFEISSAGNTLSGIGGGDIALMSNAYYNAGFKYAGSNLASSYRQQDGVHKWNIAPSGTAGNAITFTQAMTLDASGNLGIGTASPTQKLTVAGNIGTTNALLESTGTNVNFGTITAGYLAFLAGGGSERARITSGGILLIGTSSASAGLGAGGLEVTDRIAVSTGSVGTPALHCNTDSNTGIYYPAADTFGFSTGGTERARITSGGDLLVGTTSQPTSADNRVAVVGTRGIDVKSEGGTTATTATFWNNATTGDNSFVSFRTETADTSRGSITYNRGAGQVAYNTTSDARLKENIADAEEAGSKIDAMQVRQFDWKETGNHLDYGFVAQELHVVAPHAVSKPEDEDAMWSVDYSKLVPMLVKEIQSLRSRVAALEAK